MKAIEELRHEHEAIGRLLTILEEQLAAAREGGSLDPDLLRGAIEFLRGFADGCHHGKEETALFPLLAAKGSVLQTGPVKVLTGEHEAGRHLIGEIEAAIPGIESGHAESTKDAVSAIELYTRLLRRHIEKEEGIIFVLAESLATEEESERLAEQFAAVEANLGAGVHDRFEALLLRLEQASLAG